MTDENIKYPTRLLVALVSKCSCVVRVLLNYNLNS